MLIKRITINIIKKIYQKYHKISNCPTTIGFTILKMIVFSLFIYLFLPLTSYFFCFMMSQMTFSHEINHFRLYKHM